MRSEWTASTSRAPLSPWAVFRLAGEPRRPNRPRLTAAQWKELFATPDGAFISRKAVNRWHLRAGEIFQLTTPRTRGRMAIRLAHSRCLASSGTSRSAMTDSSSATTTTSRKSEPPARRGLGNTFTVSIADPSRASCSLGPSASRSCSRSRAQSSRCSGSTDSARAPITSGACRCRRSRAGSSPAA